MKYKVGDKVRVYLPVKPMAGKFIYTLCPATNSVDCYDLDMQKLHGQVVTIISVNYSSYRIDAMRYSWLQCWLKPVHTIITKRK
jgi:hypothetical protein